MVEDSLFQKDNNIFWMNFINLLAASFNLRPLVSLHGAIVFWKPRLLFYNYFGKLQKNVNESFNFSAAFQNLFMVYK